MKTIDIKDQPRLGIAQTFRMGLNDLHFRLFRSAVTLMVIAVAVAFMMNMICEAISTRSAGEGARRRTAQQRLGSYWVARLSSEGTVDEILRELGEPGCNARLLQEAQTMGGISAADFPAYRSAAVEAAGYLKSFDKLDYGRRRICVRNASGTGIFDRLQDAEHMNAFESSLKQLKSVRLPGARGDFQKFLHNWPVVKAQTTRIQKGRGQAIARATGAIGSRSLVSALVEADGKLGDGIRRAGLTAFDSATAKSVALDAAEREDMRLLEESIQNTDLRGQIAIRQNGVAGDVNTGVVWNIVRKRSGAQWYLGRMKKLGLSSPRLTPDRAISLAGIKADKDLLDRSLVRTATVEGGFLGLGGRMAWLVIISCVVCVVGIANAMLMAVTERFREIATLKCLGALDGYIMLLFVVEACLLGLLGGLVGGFLGSAIGFSRMMLAFRELLVGAFPVGPWLAAMGVAVLMGGLLATIAGVYPSYVAARLAPMEAMRIE